LSAVAVAAAAPAGAFNWPMGAKIANWTIAFIVFIGGFVIVEPAPYDILLVAIVAVWAAFGLKLDRRLMPMTVLMLAYVAGGFLSLTQIDASGKPILYVATTGFLVMSSIFFAAIVAESPESRLRIIGKAYVASAVIVSLIGILAYFGAFPNAELFTLYGRAKGTFQDPNVFGPFLVLPATILARDVLTRRLRESTWRIVWLLVIVAAIFLSFSRAAWGMVALAVLAAAYLAFATEKRQLARFRLVAYLLAGFAVVSLMIATAISIPAVRDLYEQRAHVVQEYDEGQYGRFERHAIGFFLVQEKPLGIGPFAFGKTFGEDEHNTWLKGFTVYGWLGGFAYIILAAWTVAAAAPLLFKPRPWQPLVQCTYAVFLGHLVVHNVIDNDHWRHLFLIYGILWGAIAAEKLLPRRRAPTIARTAAEEWSKRASTEANQTATAPDMPIVARAWERLTAAK